LLLAVIRYVLIAFSLHHPELIQYVCAQNNAAVKAANTAKVGASKECEWAASAYAIAKGADTVR
jgi:hypothetical protein